MKLEAKIQMDATGAQQEGPGHMLHVGQRDSLVKTISDGDILRFAEVSGDFNPVHLDDDFAEQTRFKGRVAHGMICASMISAVLGTRLPGPGTIYLSQSLKFLAPVFIGDTIEATVEVEKMRQDKPIVTLKTECRNQRGEMVLDGEAVVLVDTPPAGYTARTTMGAIQRAQTEADVQLLVNDAAQVARDVMDMYVDEGAAVGQRYLEATNRIALAGLKATFDIQSAAIQVSRAWMGPFDTLISRWTGLIARKTGNEISR